MHMMTEENQSEAKDANKPARQSASLSSTMPITMDEVFDDSSEMALTIRSRNQSAPYNMTLTRDPYTIGRHESVDIHILGTSVSRKHARLFFLHDEEILEDLNSTNGTFVNGVRVTRCVLQDKDIIRVGDTTMLFSRSQGQHGEGK